MSRFENSNFNQIGTLSDSVGIMLESYKSLIPSYNTVAQDNWDWTQSLKQAFQDALALYPKMPKIICPAGRINITSEITLNNQYALFLQGQGKKYGTYITVSNSVDPNTPLDAMFHTTGTFYNILTDNICFDANNRANKIFDFYDPVSTYGVSYSRFTQTDFVGLRKSGYGLYGLSWVTKVDSCYFAGYGDTSDATTNWWGTAIVIAGASNGVEINKADFGRLEVAVTSISEIISVAITECTFDNVRGMPIMIPYGAKNLTIEENYFEACGGLSETFTVYNGNPATVSVSALIGLSMHPNDWRFNVQSVTIKKNYFVNSGSTYLVACNSVVDVVIENNTVDYANLTGNQHDAFIYLFGYGANYYSYNAQFTSILSQNNNFVTVPPNWGTSAPILSIKNVLATNITGDASTDYAYRYGTKGIVIKDKPFYTSNRDVLPVNLLPKNLISLSNASLTVTPYSKQNNKTVYQMVTGAGTPPEISLCDDLKKVQGKWVRLSAKVIQPSGYYFYCTLNDGTKTKIISVTGTGDVTQDTWNYMEGLFYVDPSATKFTLVMDSIYSSDNKTYYIKDLIITEASTDLSTYVPIPERIEMSALPTAGTWYLGDTVYHSAPAASGNIGWVCTTAGTANNTAWVSSTAYSVGQQVNTGGNVYQCTTAGTSGTTAPTGTGASITDGTVVWKYVNPLAVLKTFGTIGA